MFGAAGFEESWAQLPRIFQSEIFLHLCLLCLFVAMRQFAANVLQNLPDLRNLFTHPQPLSEYFHL